MLFSDFSVLAEGMSIKDGRCIFSDRELSDYTAAFLNYYYIRFEDPLKARLYIEEVSKVIENGRPSFHNASFWLWILGEYASKTADNIFLNRYVETVNTACRIIEGNWDKELTHWLISYEKGFFISNLAIAYGALLSISNSLKSGHQKLLVDIKKSIFERYMDGGKIISRQGYIDGDLSIISIPFSLLDAGNQIMAESMNVIEKELLKDKVSFQKGTKAREDLTLLLCWYYAERGETALAGKLLQKAANSWEKTGLLNADKRDDYFSYVLFAICKKVMESKSFGKQAVFKHIPSGFQNPYRKENFERHPLHPIEGEEVTLDLVVESYERNSMVNVLYNVSGIECEKSMEYVKGEETENHYTASIGSFKFGDAIEYRFAIGNKDCEVSGTYSFDVRKWLSVGKLIKAMRADDYIILVFDGLMRFSKYSSIKIKNDEGNLKFQFSSYSCDFDDCDKDDIFVKFDSYSLVLDKKSASIYVCDRNGNRLYNISLEDFIEVLCDKEGIIHKVRYNFHIEEDESFFGMGERYSAIEYMGKEIDCFVYNQYRDQKLKTYLPVPFTMSSHKYGIYLNTALYSVFKFGTHRSSILQIQADIEISEQSSSFYIFFGEPIDMISSFTKLSGRPSMVPKWSLGPWISSNNWDNQKEVLKQVEMTEQYKIPATVLVIEQWSDEATFYIFNDAQYDVKDGNDYFSYRDFRFEEWGRWPDPKAMADFIHSRGIKLLLWQAPVMKYMDGVFHAQRDEDERVMLKLNYNVKKADGSPYRIPYYEWFKGSLVPDFTNPDGADWWMKKREYLISGVGIDGFKTDGGECIYCDDTLFSDGSTGAEMRNLYPNLYIKAYYDYANSKIPGGSITFSRAGYTGAQVIPIHWAGDERSTFEAFRSSIRAGLSAGMSGIIFWGWDMGGFNGEIPSAELYIRSAQMAAFCPIMQYHAETKGEYNRDRTPWNIAERRSCPEAIDIFKKYADLRMNLLPYIYNEAKLSVKRGIPMMRSMFLEYPSDQNCMHETSEYFFGSDLLVSPIIYEGERGREVYLPKGSWCQLFSGQEIIGERNIYMSAELDEIPVFIKEDSIIPLNLGESLMLCSYVGNDISEYENFTFMIYVKNKKEQKFEDDLGNRIEIYAIRKGTSLSIEVKSSFERDIHFILRGMDDTERIIINGSEQSGIARGKDIILSSNLRK